MKIALDPYMIRHLPLDRLPHAVAERLRPDRAVAAQRLLDWWVMPRATRERMAAFRQAMRASGVGLASLQPMYRWAAVRGRAAMGGALLEEGDRGGGRDGVRADGVGVRARRVARALGRRTVGANPKELCEAAWFRSMDELLPILERERIVLSVEPHPEDWIEQLQPAIDIVTNIGSPSLKLSYIAPHTFYYGDDMAAMIAQAAPILAHVRVADTFDHRKSSQLRYIVNPPGSNQIRVHQHLDIGQGEIDWDVFFRALGAAGFDGVMSSCVFAWEDRAEASSRYMRDTIQRYVDRHFDRNVR